MYPTGGISKFSSELNVSRIKEFLVLINGPLVQVITYILLLKFYPYKNSIHLLKPIHYSILFFNLLPIYPLDDSKFIFITFFIIQKKLYLYNLYFVFHDNYFDIFFAQPF